MNQLLTTVDCLQVAKLLVSIHALFDNRYDRILTDGVRADIYAIEVAATTRQEETIVIAKPYARHLVHIALLLQDGLCKEVVSLVFVHLGANGFAAIVAQVEELQVFNRRFTFARHLVFVSFQCGAWFGHSVYHPKFFHGTLVGSYGDEMA